MNKQSCADKIHLFVAGKFFSLHTLTKENYIRKNVNSNKNLTEFFVTFFLINNFKCYFSVCALSSTSDRPYCQL